MRAAGILLLFALAPGPCAAEIKLLVTVVERRSGKPVTGLAAGDFTVFDDGSGRPVKSVEYASRLMDVMLLLDTSLMGNIVQPAAETLVEQLQPKEQMAIVSFDSSANLAQDFTASKELLQRAIASLKYGNSPRVLDALYAAIDGGFQASTFRRVIVLLTAGFRGGSRVAAEEVVRLARRYGVSIYPVYVAGGNRSMFEGLAKQTGGACFSLPDMKRESDVPPGRRIFEVVRSCYTLTLVGNLSLGERVKIEVKRPEKLIVSGLPLD